ncbi:SCO3374 family protein [Streptomyces sp. HUAS ZL42]|uniref:SCO3374 family protein n=1 Tax=Streptomyces sp. HUAS ZL42 TaxID=3231715 RepID=UPI00345E0944
MAGPVLPIITLPLPRRPLEVSDQVRRWYENELGWATVPASPGDPGMRIRLRVGVRFDVLDVPAEAGLVGLRRLGPDSPVALRGERMRLLVAAGSADEMPGLLDWLEWGSLPLDMVAVGAGGTMEAPLPPGAVPPGAPVSPGPGTAGTRPLPPDPVTDPVTPLQGAAVWLRPPVPGCEVEASLPTLSAMGGDGSAPDLVRLVDTMATQCHRIRLRRGCAQPSAFS